MINKMAMVILLGLYVWLAGCAGAKSASATAPGSDAQSKKPPVMKMSTENVYKFIEKSGQYVKELSSRNIYKYDSQGNEIEGYAYDGAAKLAKKETAKFNEKGKQIEGLSYDAAGNLLVKQVYQYDEKGNLCERANYDPIGKLTDKWIRKSDAHGNMIEVSYEGVSKPKSKYTYRYDAEDKIQEVAGYDAEGKIKWQMALSV